MDNKIILVLVVMNKYLLLLFLIVCVKWIYNSIFEVKTFILAPFKDCREGKLFKKIRVWDYIKLIEFKVQGRKSFLWKFFVNLFVDEVNSLLPVAAFHIDTIGVDIILNKRSWIEVLYGLDSGWVLRVQSQRSIFCKFAW